MNELGDARRAAAVEAAIKRIKERPEKNTNSDGLKKGFTNVSPYASRVPAACGVCDKLGSGAEPQVKTL